MIDSPLNEVENKKESFPSSETRPYELERKSALACGANVIGGDGGDGEQDHHHQSENLFEFFRQQGIHDHYYHDQTSSSSSG